MAACKNMLNKLLTGDANATVAHGPIAAPDFYSDLSRQKFTDKEFLQFSDT